MTGTTPHVGSPLNPPPGLAPATIRLIPALLLLLLLMTTTAFAQNATNGAAAIDKSRWKSLFDDGLHDPQNPALAELQQPADALSQLPADTAGNLVRWVKALKEGYIAPRTQLDPGINVLELDMDVILPDTAGMPMVRFPHKQHTAWLDCVNCHDNIFLPKAGATPVNMFAVLQGRYCGRCHGAVAFPLTECTRCHSVDRNKYTGPIGAIYHESDQATVLKMLEKSKQQSALDKQAYEAQKRP